jgi:hypothetical protein
MIDQAKIIFKVEKVHRIGGRKCTTQALSEVQKLPLQVKWKKCTTIYISGVGTPFRAPPVYRRSSASSVRQSQSPQPIARRPAGARSHHSAGFAT